MPLITLTTDFGYAGSYVGQMKGVIATIAPGATIVDITHAIGPQGVREGALVLAEAAPWYPPGTIHVAVIDPGVGTERRILCLEAAGQIYVAPDNGLLSRLLADAEDTSASAASPRAYEVAQVEMFLPQVSATFHGRDIMAPVAARLAMGTSPSELGPVVPLKELVRLPWPVPLWEEGQIHGCVQAVDTFGNLVTNIAAAMLPADPETCSILCGGAEIESLSRTYGEQDPGELVALVGSAGWLELAVVGGSAADRLKVAAGEPVVVTK